MSDGLSSRTAAASMSRENVDLTTEGADVKLATLLLAITSAAALTGCRACWIDRVNERPLKYGSLRDKLSYSSDGPSGYRPCYHCGPVDGLRDWKSVRHAALSSANQALSEQFNGELSRDFKYGFQQAFIDVANGGNGTLPAIPPSRYWSAPYRTTWGHNKARNWFEGYQAGANTAKCCAMREAQTIATSAYRTSDQRTVIGLDGAASPASPITTGLPSQESTSPIPASAPMSGWNPGVGRSQYSSNPYSNPYSRMIPPPGMPPMPRQLMPLRMDSGHSFGPAPAPEPRLPNSPSNPVDDVTQALPPPPQFTDGGGHSVAPGMTSEPAAAPNSATDNHWKRFAEFGTGDVDSTSRQCLSPPVPASATETAPDAATPNTTETNDPSDPSSHFAEPDGDAFDSQGESR